MFRVLALRSGKLWRFFDDSDPEAKLLKDKGNHWRALAYAKAAFQEYANKVVSAQPNTKFSRAADGSGSETTTPPALAETTCSAADQGDRNL